MRRCAENEIEYQKESYTRWNKEKKGIFLELWIEKMVLKDNGYNKEEPYLYSGQYSLLSALLVKWVSFAIKDWQYLINFLKDNRKQKICLLTPWSKLHRRKLSKKLKVSRENVS